MPWSPEAYRSGLLAAVERHIEAVPRANGEEIILDDHQQEAMQEVTNTLREGRLRAFSIVHSCGAGKTILGATVAASSQEAKRGCPEGADRRDLVLVPERAVLTTVEGEYGEILNPSNIGVWGMGRKSLDRPVVLATIQALQVNRRELAKFLPLDRTDLLIGDEADTYLTEARRTIVEQFQGALRVGFTATPKWPDGRDIEELWGPKIHHLSLSDAIVRGVNVPPLWTLYASRVAEEHLTLRGGDYEEKVLAAALKSVEIHRAIPSIYRTVVPREDRDRFPTIIFVPSTALVEAVTATMREEFGAEGVTVKGWTGETITDRGMERDIEEFEHGRLHMLVLCEMAGRGLDLPMARVLIDAFPTLSRTKLEHRCGRVLRRMRNGGKPWSVIIQIHPESTRFRPLVLPDLLDERAWEDAKRGRPLLAGEGEDPGAPVLSDVEALRRRIDASNPPHSLTLVRELDVYQHLEERAGNRSWDEHFEKFRAFCLENPGKWPNERAEDETERSLDRWLREQRARLRDGKCTKEQASKLNEMRVQAAEDIAKKWYERCTELEAFRAAHPDKWPSQFAETEAERSLRAWLEKQRARLRDGKLTQEQTRKFAEMGVQAAEKKEDIAKTWYERCTELEAFRATHPDKWPRRFGAKDETERSLDRWLREQRARLRDGKCTKEQASKLNEMRVQAAEDIAKKWYERCTELEAFRAAHPDKWPMRFGAKDETERSLAVWLQTQRIRLRDGKLTADQTKKLAMMGVQPTRNWNVRFAELHAFCAEHVGGLPGERVEEETERSLALWLKVQCQKLCNGDLTEEQAKKLTDLGIQKDVEKGKARRSWDMRFSDLQAFRTTHLGEWPSQYAEDEAERSLGTWLKRTRSRLRKGELTEEQAEKLRGMGVEAAKKHSPQ